MTHRAISNDELSAILKQSQEQLSAFHVAAMQVFGSCARNEAGADSVRSTGRFRHA